jgi:hypothetical protein
MASVVLHPWPAGFWGLAGYYQKFILDFSTVAAPLTWLLRKDAFSWMDEADAVY